MEENRGSIREEMDEIRDLLREVAPAKSKNRRKEFKLPIKSKLTKKRISDNWVTVIKINENRNIDFVREKIIDQTIVVDDVPILANSDYILNYKGKPIMIVPTWSVKPFSPTSNFKSSLSDGSNSVGYSLLLARMKAGALGKGKKMGGTAIIGILVALAVLAYVLFGGGA